MDQKDRSIVTQVAAKIAADLTPLALGAGTVHQAEEVGNVFVRVFSVVLDGVFDGLDEVEAKHNGAPRPVGQTGKRVENNIQQIADAFGATIENTSNGSVRIAGKAHGDVPSWLIAACAKTGTTAVFDNRDKLSQNPKRPHFVDADNRDNAFWPPKG